MQRAVPLIVATALVLIAGAAAATASPPGDVVEEVEKTAQAALGGGSTAAPPPSPGGAPLPDMGLQPVAVLVGLLVLPLIAGGVRHITRDNVLEHEARKAIYEHLWQTGGANLRAIADALDLSSTNATWHLDKLVKAELVATTQANGLKLYYPRGGGRLARELCQANAVLANENARAVLEAVLAEPGTHQREIARTLDINHGTVRWHLQRLTEIDLIHEVDTDGRAKGFAATQLAEKALSGPSGERGPLSQVSESNI